MKRMLFNATQAEELRVAIVDGQKLIDLDIETVGKEQRKGNVYKGLITRIEPSLEACFVDYGTDRHGFLPFKEVSRSYFQGYEGGRPRIQDVLREGMEVVVQVEKDERGNKGAALTTYISLAGRYLVLMPNNPRGGGVSRRIEGEERQELKDLLVQLEVPQGMSLIARTAGIGRNYEELQWDLGYLMQLWRAIEGAAGAQNAPFLILQESSLVIRAIRDYYHADIGEILIDTDEIYDQARQFISHVMPNTLGRVKLYKDSVPLFSRFQIEHQIETAFSRAVQLPSGGAIVIDHTEALVSVDVNSARATKGADIEETAFKTNMEAAEEIARQLRLRDLGGLIVIDFIDMENAKNQRDVENRLREVLKYDRARVQMGKLSRFGLLELSRQRLQPSLGETSHEPCPRCHGIGFIRGTESSALHILRIIQEEAMKENTGAVHAQVPVDVATFLLNEKRAEIHSIEERLDVSVVLIPNVYLETPHYKIVRLRHDDLLELGDAPSYSRVEVQDEDVVTNFGQEKPKVERLEAAVKGITPLQPAPQETVRPAAKPIAVPDEPGFFSRLSSWFKSALSADDKPVEAPKKPAASPSQRAPRRGGERRPNTQGRRPQNGDDSRRRQPASAGETRQEQPAQRAARQERPERTERPDRTETRTDRPEARTDRPEARTDRPERNEPRPRREPREPREPREAREPRDLNAAGEERNDRPERTERPERAERPARPQELQSRRRQPLPVPEENATPAAPVENLDLPTVQAGEGGENTERTDRSRRRRSRGRRRENTEQVAAGVMQEGTTTPVFEPVADQARFAAEQAEASMSRTEEASVAAPVPEAYVSEAAEPVREISTAVLVQADAEVPAFAPVQAEPVFTKQEAEPEQAAYQAPATVEVVEQAPVEVLSETVVVAEPEAPVEVQEQAVPIAEAEIPAPAQEIAAPVSVDVPAEVEVERQPEVQTFGAVVAPVAQEAAPVDLGDLVMVSTRSAETVAPTAPEAPQGGLRRRDVLQRQAAQAAQAAIELKQVETRND